MKTIQTDEARLDNAIALADQVLADSVALSLDAGPEAWSKLKATGLRAVGWWQVARDPDASAKHPEWMHAPQHSEWLRKFPQMEVSHPALVAPYIGLRNIEAADHALERLHRFVQHSDIEELLLADIQGPPMGCGCGNPSCRSWDNSPGPKVAPSTYQFGESLFPLEFFRRAQDALPKIKLIPVLCAECERGIRLSGVEDPDGPEGTDLCQGVPCHSPCALEYWPRLLEAFRKETQEIALLLTIGALEKDHPTYGVPRAWAKLAHRHYGVDLLPVIEPQELNEFGNAIVALAYEQSVWPASPPTSYVPSEPPVICGCG